MKDFTFLPSYEEWKSHCKPIKKVKTHIAIEDNDKTLCGRSAWANTHWIQFVKKQRKADWCKVCKMLYNANHSASTKHLLK